MKIIILGAGFIGSNLAKKAVERGFEVSVLGRKDKKEVAEILPLESINYIQFTDLSAIENLSLKGGVFFNAAWKGINKLTDGSLENQLNNAILASEAVRLAKRLECAKFINIGSQEEKIFKDFLNEDWKDKNYTSNALFYSASKYAAKELCELVAYLEKIDFINTRFSIVLDKELSGSSFVAKTLLKIKEGGEFESPKNEAPCEIISLDELMNAFLAVAEFGQNKKDYYLGLGKTNELKEYFKHFKELKEGLNKELKSLNLELFSAQELEKDTGFKFKKDFNIFAKEALQ